MSVSYVAPPSCPSRASFIAELESRSKRARVTSDRDHARTLNVTIEGARGGASVAFTGSLSMRDLDGHASERRVGGDTCADVVSALAFVAAVAIDARDPAQSSGQDGSGNGNGSATTSGPSTAPSGSVPAAATASGASKETPKDPQKEAPRVIDPPSSLTENSRSIDRDDDGSHAHTPAVWSLAVGANGQVVAGPTPNPSVAIPLFVELSRNTKSIFSPSARLRFERTSGSGQSGNAGADFTWTAGSIDLCPARIHDGGLLADACARVDAGLIDASGAGVSPSRDAQRPWVSAGAVARIRWEFAAPFFAEAEGAIAIPLIRDRFFVEPDTTVFRAPVAGWGGALGLGLTIF